MEAAPADKIDCPGFTPEAVVNMGNRRGRKSSGDPIINNLLLSFFENTQKESKVFSGTSTRGEATDEKSGSSYCPCTALYIFNIESQKRIKGIDRFKKACRQTRGSHIGRPPLESRSFIPNAVVSGVEPARYISKQSLVIFKRRMNRFIP
jgi:hypothetical protein